MECNVLIVGAGPAGTAAAAHLGQLGVRDVVLVDRHDFPRDKTCGSGVSPRGLQALKDLGVWHEVEPEAYWIKGLRLVTPQNRETYTSAGEEAMAIVCQRRTLDHILLKRATGLGTKFIPNFSGDRLLTETTGNNGSAVSRVTGVAAKDGRQIHARYTVVAGGTHCRLVPEGRPRRIIQAIMGWWEGVPFRPNFVEMVFDKMIAPYYGWLFPESADRVNIGITYEDPVVDGTQRLSQKRAGQNESGQAGRNARQVFQQFLDKHYATRISGAKQIGGWKGHPIAYSYKIDRLTSPGRFVIGESGLLTHPATAEGIYQGMRSGMLAAEALRDALDGAKSEADAMQTYERAVRRAFLVSFLGGGIFRKAVKTPLLDWAVRVSEAPAVQSAATKMMAALYSP